MMFDVFIISRYYGYLVDLTSGFDTRGLEDLTTCDQGFGPSNLRAMRDSGHHRFGPNSACAPDG